MRRRPKRSKVEMCNELITPETAMNMLEASGTNFRRLQRATVVKYVSDMENERWEDNGATVKMSGHQIIDGQHRLAAIVESMVPLYLWVARNVEHSRKVVATIDAGFGRSLAQYLAWSKYQNCSSLSGIIRSVHHYITDPSGYMTGGTARGVSAGTLISFLEENRERLLESLDVCKGLKGMGGVITPISVIGFIAPAESPKNSEMFRWFVSAVRDGADLQEGDPVLSLRKQIARSTKTGSMHRSLIRPLCVLTWNKTLQGESGSVVYRPSGPSAQRPPTIQLEEDAE